MIQIKDWPFYLYREYLSSEEADSIFHRAKQEILWKTEEIKIFGKTYPQPRLISWIADQGIEYSYSGKKYHPNPWPDFLDDIRRNIHQDFQIKLNSVLCNFYRDGNDKMGWHSDNEKELGPEPNIASLSLGVTRDFKIKMKSSGQIETIELNHGDLLLMKGKAQENFSHALPPRKKVREARINFTFRQILSF